MEVGDRVAINTSLLGHVDWEFGTVVRKTKRTRDIVLVRQNRPPPAPYMFGEISPIWRSSRDKVKVWSGKDGWFWHEKDHLVYPFDATERYTMSS